MFTTKIVNSYNDWDPLKRVTVGCCDNSVIPPEEPALSEKIPADSPMRGMWSLRPLESIERGNECIENLVKILQDHDVIVDRAEPIQWNQAIATPDWRNDAMENCMPPRDILIAIEDRLKLVEQEIFVTNEVEPLWDAADVLRIGKDLFIQHSLTTNRAAMEWFQRKLPDNVFLVLLFVAALSMVVHMVVGSVTASMMVVIPLTVIIFVQVIILIGWWFVIGLL